LHDFVSIPGMSGAGIVYRNNKFGSSSSCVRPAVDMEQQRQDQTSNT
jgi:hypothetical protein